MGLLDLMFGRSMDDDAYTLSKAEYEAAFAVAVRRTELEALEALVRTEAETPYLEEGEEIGAVLEETLSGEEFDAEAWRDRMQEPRRAVEPVLERWHEQLDDDVAVVYVLPSVPEDLLAFLNHCKQRHDQEHDPFDLPDRAADVMALVTRLEDALEREASRVFVADEHVPTTE